MPSVTDTTTSWQAHLWPYRRALAGARTPAQTAFAQLGIARVMAKGGRQREADAAYRNILRVPAAVVDDQNVPFTLYAARRRYNQLKKEILQQDQEVVHQPVDDIGVANVRGGRPGPDRGRRIPQSHLQTNRLFGSVGLILYGKMP